MTFRWCLAFLVCVATAGCEWAGLGHVVLDMAVVRQALEQARITVQSLQVQVTAEDIAAPITVDVSLASLFAAFDVPAGPARTFQVTARSYESGVLVPVYWGQVAAVALLPDSTLNLVIPAFPAGEAQGTVRMSNGSAVPANVNLTATYVSGSAPISSPVTIAAKDGTFTQALSVGLWSMGGTVQIDGTTYTAVPPTEVQIQQGAIANPTVTLTTTVAGGLSLAFTQQPAASVIAGQDVAVAVAIMDGNNVRTDLGNHNITMQFSIQGSQNLVVTNTSNPEIFGTANTVVSP